MDLVSKLKEGNHSSLQGSCRSLHFALEIEIYLLIRHTFVVILSEITHELHLLMRNQLEVFYYKVIILVSWPRAG